MKYYFVCYRNVLNQKMWKDDEYFIEGTEMHYLVFFIDIDFHVRYQLMVKYLNMSYVIQGSR